MEDKKKGNKSSSKLKKLCNFFAGVFRSCEETSSANVSSVNEASGENVNLESVVRKEVLADGSKGNDDSNTSSKDSQDKGSKDLSGLVKRKAEARENVIKTVRTEGGRQTARNLIRNRDRQNRSKSVEVLCGKQASVRSKSPKPCQFKTEEGDLFCEVCSWYTSDGVSSFLDHCNSKEHKHKMKDRFEWEEEKSRIAEINKWISEFGLIYLEQDSESESFVRCKLCEKLFPVGKHLEKFLVNVGIHIEGKGHVNNLKQSLESTEMILSLMHEIQKSPTGNLTNLNEIINKEKQKLKNNKIQKQQKLCLNVIG